MMVKLKSVITEYSVRNKNDDDIPVYSVTNEQGFCTGYFGKDVSSKDRTTYKIVPYGCFAYNPSRINVGSVDWQHCEDKVIVSPLYVVFEVAECLDQRYLLHYLKSDIALTLIKANASGSVRDNLKLSVLQEFPINLRSIEEQRKIADNLDRVDHLIGLYNHEITVLDNLVKSRFIECFGDMYLNSKGWPEANLESMADVVSGITKGRKTKNEDLTEVPYMAVSNVKDGYIDWTTVKTIEATQQEIEQYRLLPDDVLMTEGGDPDKVGRGAIIKAPLKNCIHQNHIFRVRLDESVLLPEFFAEYLQHQRAKRYFLGCAKQTTGIASINMKQLRTLPVLVPPMAEQTAFVSFKAETDKSKFVEEMCFGLLFLWMKKSPAIVKNTLRIKKSMLH